MNKLPRRDKLETLVRIPINNIELEAELFIPPNAKGLVIFAHGSGSSRHSPRNQFVAKKLQSESLATLLVDLLSEIEDIDFRARFNIDLLTERLAVITDWAVHDSRTKDLNIGYFGASTGAASAIFAAEGSGNIIKAIVSRGGRVDLAEDVADKLNVPTLLIVGQEDHGVLEANDEFFLKLSCKKEIVIIPRATHLFEEPGTLEQVADKASEWFKDYLCD